MGGSNVKLIDMERAADGNLLENCKDPPNTGTEGCCAGKRAAHDPNSPGKGDGSEFETYIAGLIANALIAKRWRERKASHSDSIHNYADDYADRPNKHADHQRRRVKTLQCISGDELTKIAKSAARNGGNQKPHRASSTRRSRAALTSDNPSLAGRGI
ncbi:hypothetical protein FPY71_07130 [Aureimonas fodinaquatilis]|uniref:Uncharacterized protein n=2 Tax=Aureimonas fodinaquatilis TaxID=2565783 RepID=A0A5B0DWU7_9HYPH|nr:hypothetical protein FPY71_07130 [Aureimonas fodinaquatilis]